VVVGDAAATVAVCGAAGAWLGPACAVEEDELAGGADDFAAGAFSLAAFEAGIADGLSGAFVPGAAAGAALTTTLAETVVLFCGVVCFIVMTSSGKTDDKPKLKALLEAEMGTGVLSAVPASTSIVDGAATKPETTGSSV